MGNGFKNEIDAYKWKRDRVETKKTIEEIERKAKRVGIAYNKGAYQYINNVGEAKTLGRK